MTDSIPAAVPGSFRDPAGFVFEHDGAIYRQINKSAATDWDAFVASGLYERLAGEGDLVRHVNADDAPSPRPELRHCVVRPERIPFISYPYEWSFSQLQDAALTTLRIQKHAIDAGFTLRDCSAYNIQFVGARPVFIDSLSFGPYEEGEPWVAYRQFCQHFLAPLALMAYRNIQIARLMRPFIDGIPLELASSLLPSRTRMSPSLLTHLHLHARSQRRHAATTEIRRKRKVSRMGLLGLVDNLEGTVKRLKWEPGGTEWGDYYDATNYSDDAMRSKADTIAGFVDRVAPATVWDLGANTGNFSRIASQRGAFTLAFDIDPAAVEKNYRYAREHREATLLPLVMDLTNPSPALGWAHTERDSMAGRGPADMVMALALIHHLAISNNVPLRDVGAFLSRVGRHAIIEFVPKTDSQVRRLLTTREDVFPDYTEDGFRSAMGEHFEFVDDAPVAGSERTLYLLRRRDGQ